MEFNDKWIDNHKNWNIYIPNYENIFKINTFDDGNKKYENYINKWIIYGDAYNGQKVALINKENNEIQIGSISRWKIDLID